MRCAGQLQPALRVTDTHSHADPGKHKRNDALPVIMPPTEKVRTSHRPVDDNAVEQTATEEPLGTPSTSIGSQNLPTN
ncbi:unnamed protein product [Dovyalis caffra]|uniref:Prolactin receptor n=1 Tax=Dovyalis caffra TaxID=77055 RepID=A0AAV1RCZ8_9ROSI|nr:unnamed protein product [Dovyalis caffra]